MNNNIMNNKGFTLVELIIATTIILIVSLGFFGWASTIIQTNLSIEKNNTAYSMAMDVAERLQRMSDNTLIQKKSGSTSKCVGYASSGTYSGTLTECRNAADSAVDCSAGDPNKTGSYLSPGTTGMTRYTNPNYVTSRLYLYDNNACAGQMWIDCRSGLTTASNIDAAANASIDHPNAISSAYDSINPIRSYKNTTYYAVWTVAYMPCNAGTNTDRRKILVTVYWLDPEPTASTASGALSSTIKSVSIVTDKVIGTES